MEFEDIKTQNRDSVLYALAYLIEGISLFVDTAFQNHHKKLQVALKKENVEECKKSCSKLMKNDDRWCNLCELWKTAILSKHVYGSEILGKRKRPDWSNIDSSKWPKDAKEVEKCYHPNWAIKMKGSNSDDISVLIGKLINCTDIRSLFANTEDPDKIRVIRNRIIHNPEEISFNEKKTYCKQMLKFLKTLKTGDKWTYKEAEKAHKKIKLFKKHTYIDLLKDKIITSHELNKLKERMKNRTAKIYNINRIFTLVVVVTLLLSLIYAGFERTFYRTSISICIISICVFFGALLIPTLYLGYFEIRKTQLYAYVVVFMDRLFFVERQEDDICEYITFIPRDKWGARLPKSIELMETPVMNVFVHHTAGSHGEDTEICSKIVQSIQNMHMDNNKWDDIAYNFLIGEDGCVYEGRGWNRVGAHTLGWNRNSVSFAFLGNYNDKQPNSLALKALKDAISSGIKDGYISPYYTLYGHRDKRPTESPGNYLYAEIRNFKHYHQKP